MGRFLTVKLTLECDCHGCEKLTAIEAREVKQAKEDADRAGWVIHPDGQVFCSAACNERGFVRRPNRICRPPRKGARR